MILRQPFDIAGVANQYDVYATVAGGGLSGQAGAVKHGISKALQLHEPALRAALKAAGFLTRDSRVVERKKYGKAKARRVVPVLEALIVQPRQTIKGARHLPRPFSVLAAGRLPPMGAAGIRPSGLRFAPAEAAAVP